MAKRKPGRPRKAESFIDLVAQQRRRGPGRPRKESVEALPESKPMLSRYAVENVNGILHVFEANAFSITSSGDLAIIREGQGIAAFRQWVSIVKVEESVEPPKVESTPAPQPENISNTYSLMESVGITGAGQPAGSVMQGYGGDADFNVNQAAAGVHVTISPDGVRTMTFPNGIELTEADRPE
jgi:hypothetical protein